MIRLLVCENRELVLSGIRSVINETADIEFVGQIPSLRDYAATVRRLRPDVVLISATGSAVRIEHVRALLLDGSPTPPIILMTAGQDEDIIDVLLDGARGALLADSEPADIIRCIRAVAAGGAVLAPSIAGQLLDLIGDPPEPAATPPAALATLSDREREVLGLLAAGRSYAEIAAELSISAATVRSHVHHVVAKLKLRHPAQAVTLAYRFGLVRR